MIGNSAASASAEAEELADVMRHRSRLQAPRQAERITKWRGRVVARTMEPAGVGEIARGTIRKRSVAGLQIQDRPAARLSGTRVG